MIFHQFIFKLSAYAILFMLVYTALHLVPFGVFADVTKYNARDVCLGDNIVVYESDRTTLFGMGIQGETWGQIVRIDGQNITETTIFRGSQTEPISFAYEPNTTSARYETQWDDTFDEVGVYGAHEWITIHPLPFITLTKFNSGLDTTFNVIVCET